MLRMLLVEAAQMAVRYDPGLRREYLHRCHQKPKAVAKVAAARKLAVRLYSRCERLPDRASEYAASSNSSAMILLCEHPVSTGCGLRGDQRMISQKPTSRQESSPEYRRMDPIAAWVLHFICCDRNTSML